MVIIIIIKLKHIQYMLYMIKIMKIYNENKVIIEEIKDILDMILF